MWIVDFLTNSYGYRILYAYFDQIDVVGIVTTILNEDFITYGIE